MIVKTNEDIQQLLNWIERQDMIAYDIESTGLNVRKDEIIGFGVSNETESFYVPHQSYNVETGALDCLIEVSDCREILCRLQNKKLIMHNGSFDSRMTYHYFGVELWESLYADSMLAKHTVDEERPFGLKDIAKKLYGVTATEEQEAMKASIVANGGTPKQFYKADLDLMAKYCEQDCLLTYRIAQHYIAEIKKQGLTEFFFTDEVMSLYTEVTIPMELHGIPVDVPKLQKAKSDIELDIEKLHDSIQAAVAPHLGDFEHWFLNKDFKPSRRGDFAQGIAAYMGWELPKTATGKLQMTKKLIEALPDSEERDFLLGGAHLTASRIREIQNLMWKAGGEKYMFNFNSKFHLKRLFFNELCCTPLSKTPTGLPQVDEDFIESVVEDFDWAKQLIQYNKLNKLNGTYISKILEEQEDGIFYPSFQQHRTVSGRYGSNLQQLPRPTGEKDIVGRYNDLIRTFFIAGEDHVFIDADYESLEPHIFAHVSGDDILRSIFNSNDDFYSTVAIQTERLTEFSADKGAENYLGKVAKDRRQRAKAYALGIAYGLTYYKLKFELGVSELEAKTLIQDYLEAFPDLAAWMKESEEQCKMKGFVRSEAGRVRHMPLAKVFYREHGEALIDPLALWHQYNETPKMYAQMKKKRKLMINWLNNSKNYQIQSLAASIMNRAMIVINRYMREHNIPGGVCFNAHDQAIIRTTKAWGRHMRGKMQEIMETNYKISVPLKAPAVIGSNFYDAH